MLNEIITPFDPLSRSERNVRTIVLSILADLNLQADRQELSGVLTEYGEADNYVVIDDLVMRFCSVQELAISFNRPTLKHRVRHELRREVASALGPIADMRVS